MKRKLEFIPAFDKRSKDPNKDFGIHGVEMRWYILGPEGAIQFVLYTNWQLPHIFKEWIGTEFSFQSNRMFNATEASALFQPLPVDVGYHSPKKMYRGQRLMTKDCPILKGKCYYDGSALAADKYFNILIEKGGEALWEALEEYYKKTFKHE